MQNRILMEQSDIDHFNIGSGIRLIDTSFSVLAKSYSFYFSIQVGVETGSIVFERTQVISCVSFSCRHGECAIRS